MHEIRENVIIIGINLVGKNWPNFGKVTKIFADQIFFPIIFFPTKFLPIRYREIRENLPDNMM